MEPVPAPPEDKDEKPAAVTPIDDVKPPTHAPATSHTTKAETTDEKSEEANDDPAAKLEDNKKPEEPKKAPKPKQPRQPGVTLAIVATVIIVLSLGLLATYAYLQSQG